VIKWIHFPLNTRVPQIGFEVIKVFEGKFNLIDSSKHQNDSDDVLRILSEALEGIGFTVEGDANIKIPVLYGENGKTAKAFEVDAVNFNEKFVIEIEAGRAFMGNQIYKDLFEVSVLVDIEYLCIAVRQIYEFGKGKNRGKSLDYEKAKTLFNTLYASNKFNLPIKGILLIGY
jgi:hypothetical protein